MAIRKIRTMGDRILNKVCRPVEEMTPKIQELVEDMLETMYDAYGVGLAAPQVGMLKRIVVIDVGLFSLSVFLSFCSFISSYYPFFFSPQITRLLHVTNLKKCTVFPDNAS